MFRQTIYKIQNVSKPSFRRKIDFQSPVSKSKLGELLLQMQIALNQQGLLKFPKVFIHPTVDSAATKKMRDILRDHEAELVDSESEATHIVFGTNEPPKEDYVRPTFKRDSGGVMVHWMYYPDRYANHRMLFTKNRKRVKCFSALNRKKNSFDNLVMILGLTR